MEKEKKKRIFDILKKIGYAITIIIGIIILSNSCYKKTKAEEIVIDYQNYNLLVSIEDSNLTSGTYEGHLVVIATINTNQLNFISIDLDYPDFTCDSADLLSGPYETYGASEIIASNIYLVQSEEDYQSNSYTIIGASEYNTYMQWNNGETYNNGYGVGIGTTDASEAYNQGKEAGKQEVMNEAQAQIEANNESYETQIDTLNGIINDLNDELQQSSTGWMSFKTLLGLIFMYPIRFFKEGMDITLFGVNIGYLILGMLMIGVTLGAIGLLMGKRK